MRWALLLALALACVAPPLALPHPPARAHAVPVNRFDHDTSGSSQLSVSG